jgi:hypothetical protein
MLTTLEANFVQEYKLNGGNAKEAVLKAGYDATPRNASCIGSRLIRKPKISQALSQVEQRQLDALSQPIVKQPPPTYMELPTKDQYALKAWQRSSDESKLKDDTKFKYYDLAGKVLGHVRNDDSERKSHEQVLNIICQDLNIELNKPLPDTLIPYGGIPSDVNRTLSIPVVTASVVNTPSVVSESIAPCVASAETVSENIQKSGEKG